jgi:hypothetical protein
LIFLLQGLLAKGVDDFIRVGCLKRISKPMLKYTLRETGNSEERIDQESLKDLSEMLKVITHDLRPFIYKIKNLSIEIRGVGRVPKILKKFNVSELLC